MSPGYDCQHLQSKGKEEGGRNGEGEEEGKEWGGIKEDKEEMKKRLGKKRRRRGGRRERGGKEGKGGGNEKTKKQKPEAFPGTPQSPWVILETGLSVKAGAHRSWSEQP